MRGYLSVITTEGHPPILAAETVDFEEGTKIRDVLTKATSLLYAAYEDDYKKFFEKKSDLDSSKAIAARMCSAIVNCDPTIFPREVDGRSTADSATVPARWLMKDENGITYTVIWER